MRDAVPLPGVTPAQLVSQLAHRVFGPLQPGRTTIVLDYHGLLTRPAASATDIARRHHVTTPTVYNNVAAVRAVGARQPLALPGAVEIERPSTPEDDHLARVRIAATLGLTRPEPPATTGHSPVNDQHTVSAAQLAVARAGLRILAAVGPIPLPVLAAAAGRSRRFRHRAPMSDRDLAAALAAVGCTVDHRSRWHPPAGAVPTDRDQTILTLAAGRDLTRHQMIHMLIAAGYRTSSAPVTHYFDRAAPPH